MSLDTQNNKHSVKVYEEDTCYTKLTAKVIGIADHQVKIIEHGNPVIRNAWGIILDRTIFHPQGGGQPSDKGTINGIPILTVKEYKDVAGSPIYHFVELNDTYQNIHDLLNIGLDVSLQIDKAYRKKCAVSHTAGHLLADILEFAPTFSIYKAKSTQGHHFPGGEYIKAIIYRDIENKDEFISDFNMLLNKAINDNKKIFIGLCDNVRHIKIGESNRMCGGTHLNSTNEIESCSVSKVKTSKQIKDGNDYVEITVYYRC